MLYTTNQGSVNNNDFANQPADFPADEPGLKACSKSNVYVHFIQ